jgi:hypothetical protein
MVSLVGLATSSLRVVMVSRSLVISIKGRNGFHQAWSWASVNRAPHWYHSTPPTPPPKIHLNCVQMLQIFHAYTNSGTSPSPNLTFFRINMGTKKPHLKRWRYHCGCWLTIIQHPPAHHQLDAHYDCCGETSVEFMSGFTLVTHSVSRSIPVLYWYVVFHIPDWYIYMSRGNNS